MTTALKACCGLTVLAATCSGAVPEFDNAHVQMEPPPPAIQRPKLSNPLGGPSRRAGTGLSVLQLLVTPKRSLALLPAALLTVYMLSPALATKLWLHMLCCIGSLIEPFDSVLPSQSVLRPFVGLVQRARRSYAEEHGLVQLGESQFFDDVDGDGSGSEAKLPEDSVGVNSDEAVTADGGADESADSGVSAGNTPEMAEK